MIRVFGKGTVTVRSEVRRLDGSTQICHGTRDLSQREVLRLKAWGILQWVKGFPDRCRRLGFAQVLTQGGANFWADVIGNGGAAGTQFIGMGTSTTTALKADTTLGTAATEARVSASRSATTDTVTWTGTVTADGAKTFKEVGLFSGAGSGSPPTGATLLIHANITTATMDAAGDQVVNTITLQVA